MDWVCGFLSSLFCVCLCLCVFKSLFLSSFLLFLLSLLCYIKEEIKGRWKPTVQKWKNSQPRCNWAVIARESNVRRELVWSIMGDKTEKVDLSGRREGGKEGTKEVRFTDSREKEDEKRTCIRRLDEARRVLKKRRYEIWLFLLWRKPFKLIWPKVEC